MSNTVCGAPPPAIPGCSSPIYSSLHMLTASSRNALRRSEARVATSGVGTYIRDRSVALRLRRLQPSCCAAKSGTRPPLYSTILSIRALLLPATASLALPPGGPEGGHVGRPLRRHSRRHSSGTEADLEIPSTTLPASRACAAATPDSTRFHRDLITANWSLSKPTHLVNPALYQTLRIHESLCII